MKCCIEGCAREARSLGMCTLHYRRSRDGLNLTAPVRRVEHGLSDEARLRSKMRVDSRSGCWLWHASINTNGYGQIRFRGTTEQAHRVSYILFKGEIPKGANAYGTQNVLHTCDTPLCVNPEHLFLGDQAANASDAVAKGRWGKRGCPGESHGRALLTANDVREIRASPEPPPGHRRAVQNLKKHRASHQAPTHVETR